MAKEYSFGDVILLVNANEIKGFDEGDDTIVAERLNDSASHTIGADGEMAISLSMDRSGTLTFRLLQISDSNAIMSGLINAQENGAFVPVFVQMLDNKGNDLISGTQGYVQRQSTVTRGTGINNQEWVLVLERLDFVLGTS